MTLFPPIAQHPASVDAYIRAGWSLVPIPPNTKGPSTRDWNKRENALRSQADLSPGWGIGLAHAYSGTMALDIDDWNTAAFVLMMQGIDLNALYAAPNAVIVDSGRQGHGKLLYAMPFGLSLPSKKINQGGKTIYELRCGTSNGLTVQDVLPPSIHPVTQQPYRWAGNGHWTRLPMIPEAILKLWMASLESEHRPQVDEPVDADWEQIRSAIGHIDPDCSRDEWITVGMALHYAGTHSNNPEYALQLWDEWSKPSDKYPGEKAIETQWRSFRTDKATKVKLGSLYKMARSAGWAPPVPDVSSLFQNVPLMTPAQVNSMLRPPPPKLNMKMVPQALRDYATKVAASVGCDPTVPLFAGIAAVSGAADARTRLELKPGFKVPPVLWVMTIGKPAGKKTHGASPMFRILHQLAAEDRPRYSREMQVFEALEARHEMSKKAFLDAAKDPEVLLSGEMPHGYGDAPVRPVPLEIVIGANGTSQKVMRMAADMPRGLLVHMDEMLKWCENIVDKRSGEDRSMWTQSFEADWYRMDRVGAGTITCDNFALSIYGNIQPAGFESVFEMMAKDGMLQRFIPVMVQWELSHKGAPDRDGAAQAAYEMMIRTTFGMPALTYTLSPQASVVYDQFQDWYYRQIKDEDLLGASELFMTALGKLEGLVGRIALLWHMMSNPMSIEVPAETMTQAVEVVRGFVIPSLRYVYESNTNGFDQWCMDYIIQYAEEPTITVSQIRRSARRQMEKVNQWVQIDKILNSMYPLEVAGWVTRVDDGTQKDHAVWAINGSIATMFEDYRRERKAAKQRQLDEMYRLSPHGIPTVKGFAKVA